MFVTMACYRRVKDYGSFNSFISLQLIITIKNNFEPSQPLKPLGSSKMIKD